MILDHVIGRARRDRVGSCAKRMKTRGVALIIALILVALAAILATKLTFDGWIERRRTVGIIASEQAFQFGLGAEALAADVIGQIGQTPTTPGQAANGQPSTGQPQPNSPGAPNTAAGQSSSQVTLAQPWAQPAQPMPISAPDNPEGEPIGILQGAIEDMSGRFNLNNLAHVIMGPGGQVQQDPFPLAQFQRLLVSVGLEAKWAGIARDWIDADDQPGNPDGAEDAIYTAQNPAYRTGNWPMMSPSELMNMPGFGADRYRKIAPYVTALPTATAQINLCTASGFVIESLADNLSGEYSRNPEVLASGRQIGCFPDTATFGNVLGPKSAQTAAGRYTDTSSYFQLTTRVTLGTTEFTLYSLLWRNQSGGNKVTPLLRTFGTT
jgi:general secretion pathway protein K